MYSIVTTVNDAVLYIHKLLKEKILKVLMKVKNCNCSDGH